MVLLQLLARTPACSPTTSAQWRGTPRSVSVPAAQLEHKRRGGVRSEEHAWGSECSRQDGAGMRSGLRAPPTTEQQSWTSGMYPGRAAGYETISSVLKGLVATLLHKFTRSPKQPGTKRRYALRRSGCWTDQLAEARPADCVAAFWP